MENSMDYEEFKIKDYKYWTVYLHKNQYYLGRCYIWCKRDGKRDFFDMTNDEREELFVLGAELRDVLKKIFQVDLFNYAALANVAPHLHLHVIPRYESGRQFEGVAFLDERWGENYAPYNYDFKLDKDILFKIRDRIKKEI